MKRPLSVMYMFRQTVRRGGWSCAFESPRMKNMSLHHVSAERVCACVCVHVCVCVLLHSSLYLYLCMYSVQRSANDWNKTKVKAK